jgi:hypothetical protein
MAGGHFYRIPHKSKIDEKKFLMMGPLSEKRGQNFLMMGPLSEKRGKIVLSFWTFFDNFPLKCHAFLLKKKWLSRR